MGYSAGDQTGSVADHDAIISGLAILNVKEDQRRIRFGWHVEPVRAPLISERSLPGNPDGKCHIRLRADALTLRLLRNDWQGHDAQTGNIAKDRAGTIANAH